ncbi:MAG: TOBE domain-containing protein, partial [Halodesulfurarchaeum sp.]
PEAVYRRPANRFVASFVGDNNLFEVKSSAAGVATVEGGEEIQVAETVRPGDTLAVRPEAMHQGPDDTVLEPTVEGVEFQGTGYTIHCRLGPTELLVKTDSPPSEPFRVGFSKAAVQVLRADEQTR